MLLASHENDMVKQSEASFQLQPLVIKRKSAKRQREMPYVTEHCLRCKIEIFFFFTEPAMLYMKTAIQMASNRQEQQQQKPSKVAY